MSAQQSCRFLRMVPALTLGLMMVTSLAGPTQTESDPNRYATDRLYEEGMERARKEDYPQALAHFENGLIRARTANDEGSAAQHWLGIGYVHWLRDCLQPALVATQTARKIGATRSDLSLQARAWIQMGDIEGSRGLYRERELSLRQHRQAEGYYQKALELARAGNDERTMALATLGLGGAYLRQEDAEVAFEYYQDAQLAMWGAWPSTLPILASSMREQKTASSRALTAAPSGLISARACPFAVLQT